MDLVSTSPQKPEPSIEVSPEKDAVESPAKVEEEVVPALNAEEEHVSDVNEEAKPELPVVNSNNPFGSELAFEEPKAEDHATAETENPVKEEEKLVETEGVGFENPNFMDTNFDDMNFDDFKKKDEGDEVDAKPVSGEFGDFNNFGDFGKTAFDDKDAAPEDANPPAEDGKA